MPALFPADDLTIPNEELLYYRVFPRADEIQRVENGDGYRPASGSLRRHSQPLSVDLSTLSTPEATRDRDRSSPFHVAAFSAGLARAVGCRVVGDPEVNNVAHALVFGSNQDGTGALTKSQTKNIARNAFIVLLNPMAPLPRF